LLEQGHKKSIEDDKTLFRWLHQYLLDKDISLINKQFIDFLKSEKLKTGVTNASVNRMLALLKSVLNRAKNEWEWLDTVPYIKLLPEAEKRVRWLTKHESLRLLNELPEHLNLMARFTLSTGLRESNVVALQWSQVDMVRRCAWIHPEESKSGQGIAVPLDDNACAIIMSQLGKHQTNVFTYEGNPVTRANNRAWRNALKRAKIDDFRWHDLRHTWASWHIQNGTPIQIL
jgi:integrase